MKKDHRNKFVLAVVLLFPFAFAALGNANGGRHPPLGLLGMAVRATPSFVFCYFILASCAFTSAVMSLLIASFT